MIGTTVTIRTKDATTPPHVMAGVVPFEGSPLAVTKVAVWKRARWVELDDRYHITHIPTGWHIGGAEWKTQAAAFEVLERCEPSFPAWRLAIGKKEDPATVACAVKFKMALAATKKGRK
jgi:hypothetical protein